MENINNNNFKYTEKSNTFCNFETNQKKITNKRYKSQTNSMENLGKTLSSVAVTQNQNKVEQQQGEYKARTQLEGLKNKFINLLMRNGEKSKAYRLFAESLKQVEQKNMVKGNTLNLYPVFGFLNGKEKQELHTNQKQHKQNNKIETINKRVKQNYYNLFLRNNTLYQAVENVKPSLELRRVRKGRITYQVPAIVSQKRQERLAIKWIIESAEKRNKKSTNSFSDCLVSEILDAFNKTGQPRQRRDEQLKVAEFNRAYTRYRWW